MEIERSILSTSKISQPGFRAEDRIHWENRSIERRIVETPFKYIPLQAANTLIESIYSDQLEPVQTLMDENHLSTRLGHLGNKVDLKQFIEQYSNLPIELIHQISLSDASLLSQWQDYFTEVLTAHVHHSVQSYCNTLVRACITQQDEPDPLEAWLIEEKLLPLDSTQKIDEPFTLRP